MKPDSAFLAVIVIVPFCNQLLFGIWKYFLQFISDGGKDGRFFPGDDSALTLLILWFLWVFSKAYIVSGVLVNYFAVHEPFFVPLKFGHFLEKIGGAEVRIL